MSPLPTFDVFVYRISADAWEMVAEGVPAEDAGVAFRDAVVRKSAHQPAQGEYRIYPTDGSAHLAVELNLRDLEAKAS